MSQYQYQDYWNLENPTEYTKNTSKALLKISLEPYIKNILKTLY